MRSVIVDYVRERMTERRGGDAPHVTLNSQIGDDAGAGETEILRVHEALDELAQFDVRIVQVVEMRYFAGMTGDRDCRGPRRHGSYGQTRLGEGAAPAGGGAPVALQPATPNPTRGAFDRVMSGFYARFR